jgi:hypothetical protein
VVVGSADVAVTDVSGVELDPPSRDATTTPIATPNTTLIATTAISLVDNLEETFDSVIGTPLLAEMLKSPK